MANSGLASVNLDLTTLKELSFLAGYVIEEWPLIYLGIPLKANYKTKSFWDVVVECFQALKELKG